jgi:hypothetical protein
MSVLVEFRTADRVRLRRSVDDLPAGSEGVVVRLSVAPAVACLVRVGDRLLELAPEDLERVSDAC